MTSYLRDALVVGSVVAICAGLVGYFLVSRAQVFTADSFGHVAFTGALGALVAGLDPFLGILIATFAVGGILALLAERGRHADDVTIGSTFAWILGVGAFFASIYTTNRSAEHNGRAGITYLFGSIFSITSQQVRWVVVLGAIAVIGVVVIGRPLLFASIDPAVAAARGVPVRVLDGVLLALLAAVTTVAAPTVGSLLLLGLLAAPAGAAYLLTVRPLYGLLLSPALALAATWFGLLLVEWVPQLPPSFAILAVATAVFVAAFLAHRFGRRPLRGVR